jgi:hypothetical protein
MGGQLTMMQFWEEVDAYLDFTNPQTVKGFGKERNAAEASQDAADVAYDAHIVVRATGIRTGETPIPRYTRWRRRFSPVRPSMVRRQLHNGSPPESPLYALCLGK